MEETERDGNEKFLGVLNLPSFISSDVMRKVNAGRHVEGAYSLSFQEFRREKGRMSEQDFRE